MWSALVGSLVSLTIFMTGADDQKASEEGSNRWSFRIPGQESFIPWQGKTQAPDEQVDKGLPKDSALWVRLVDQAGRGVEADGLVGAPGLWPFVLESSDQCGFLRLPENDVARFDGGQTNFYEVLVRSKPAELGLPGEEVAFWGVINGPGEPIEADEARELRLGPARTLDVEVVDEAGEAVEGAFVRLSQGSIGILHLLMTSDEAGRASFSRIPAGNYYLTIDADGYGRQTAHVEHRPEAEKALRFVLEDGGPMRLPEAWRGPLLSELMPELAEAGEEESAQEEEEARGPSVELEIYAADARGGGVEGAWVEVWRGRERVAQGVSNGRRPLKLAVPVGAPVQVVATHGGWGEGVVVVGEAGDGDEVVVRMDGALFGEAVADRVRGVREIERVLGAPLVADGRRWLVDRPDDPGESAAFREGLARGDSLLFVRREGDGYRAVVEREGRIVEVVFGAGARAR